MRRIAVVVGFLAMGCRPQAVDADGNAKAEGGEQEAAETTETAQPSPPKTPKGMARIEGGVHRRPGAKVPRGPLPVLH